MSRLLLLCPGQGGQHPGMFDLARADPGAAALLAELALPRRSEAGLFDNRSAQPAIVAATVTMWEALRRHAPAPALVAGYSVGELSAYAVAGALDAKEAVRLAHQRAALMDAAAQATPGQCLAAVSGLPLTRLRQMLARAGFEVAIVTGDDSAIAGGLAQALPALELAVTAAGARLQRLPVTVASHTPLMAAAVAPFAALLDAASFQAQACPVLSGVGAERVSGKTDAVAALSRQLAQPIVWSECMDAAAEAGIDVALELGPGAALSRMLQARHPGIACRSVADFRSIDGIAAWLARHAG
jgi:[acyl-carrier-protein] S-malonyltransferase